MLPVIDRFLVILCAELKLYDFHAPIIPFDQGSGQAYAGRAIMRRGGGFKKEREIKNNKYVWRCSTEQWYFSVKWNKKIATNTFALHCTAILMKGYSHAAADIFFGEENGCGILLTTIFVRRDGVRQDLSFCVLPLPPARI
jgi:hypothetical protein